MDYSDPSKNNKSTKRYYKSKAKKTKNKIAVVIIRVVLISLLVILLGAGSALVGAYFSIIERAPKLDYVFEMVNNDNNYSTIIINEMTGEETDRLDSGENREYAPSEMIPDNMKNAIIAIEDERFYSHDGVDFKGVIRMFKVALTTSRSEGASTITQQVIKNKLGYSVNTIETKLQEQMLAINFEKALNEQTGSKEKTKDYILTIYLNSLFLGHGQYGVQAAALYYFNKNVWELELSECAVIAATTSNPAARSPVRYPEYNRQRQEIVLSNMLKLGMITQAEHDEALADDVYSRIQEVGELLRSQPSLHSYFNDQIISTVAADLQKQKNLTKAEAFNLVYNGGLRIYSTEDPRIQAIVDDAYQNEDNFPKTEFEIEVQYTVVIKNTLTGLTKNYDKKGIVKNWEDVEPYVETIKDKLLKDGDEIVASTTHAVVQPQSAFIVIDYHTGHVVAMAGGRGEKLTNRGLNRATGARRQPGSTFKVLAAYAPALDLGYVTAATVIDDVPYYITGSNNEIKEWPKNWYASSTGHRGLNSVRKGITNSMNILAVKTLANIGMTNAFKYLDNFGFTTISTDRGNLSAALGGLTYGVYQSELAAAYGTIANEGMYNEPVYYTKVLDHNGNVILENTLEPVQVLRKTTSYILTDMLRDTLITGTGGKARFSSDVKMPVAGKTGTTSDTKDLVFAGYTPYYAATIWIGYDYSKSLSSRTTSDGVHLVLWRKIMEEIHRPLPYKDFPKPDGIIEVQICMVSGKLPVWGLCDHDPRGSQLRTELFEAGTEPVTYCDVHREFRIDTATGKIPAPSCPEEYIETRIGIVRPEPYYGNKSTTDRIYEVPAAILNGEVCPGHYDWPTDGDGDYIPEGEPDDGGWFDPEATPEPTPEGFTDYTPPETPEPYIPDVPAETPSPEPTPAPTFNPFMPYTTPTPPVSQ